MHVTLCIVCMYLSIICLSIVSCRAYIKSTHTYGSCALASLSWAKADCTILTTNLSALQAVLAIITASANTKHRELQMKLL